MCSTPSDALTLNRHFKNPLPQATTGSEAIHDLQPKSVHQRVPTFLGSPEDVDELVASLKK
jgi:fructose-1,6-bisphosphatase